MLDPQLKQQLLARGKSNMVAVLENSPKQFRMRSSQQEQQQLKQELLGTPSPTAGGMAQQATGAIVGSAGQQAQQMQSGVSGFFKNIGQEVSGNLQTLGAMGQRFGQDVGAIGQRLGQGAVNLGQQAKQKTGQALQAFGDVSGKVLSAGAAATGIPETLEAGKELAQGFAGAVQGKVVEPPERTPGQLAQRLLGIASTASLTSGAVEALAKNAIGKILKDKAAQKTAEQLLLQSVGSRGGAPSGVNEQVVQQLQQTMQKEFAEFNERAKLLNQFYDWFKSLPPTGGVISSVPTP